VAQVFYTPDVLPVTKPDRHPFNSLFSWKTWVNWQQTGYTNLGLNEARDDGVAVASAGRYANHLYLAPDTQPQHRITQSSTAWMLFLMPNHQYESTEGNTKL